MARIPDDLVRDAIGWLAEPDNVIQENGQKWPACVVCRTPSTSITTKNINHTNDCLHIRALYWLAAEKVADSDTPLAKESDG